MTPAQVESVRVGTPLEHEPHPGNAPAEQVCPHHAAERPRLEVLALDSRIEDHRPPVRMKATAELYVLHRRAVEALLVEAPELEEDVPTNCSQSSPEGRGRSSRSVMDVMVKEVTEVGYETPAAGIVVIRAEDRHETGVEIEGIPDSGKYVSMHLDVGIDEYEHFTSRPLRTDVACSRGAESCRLLDEDELLGPRLCSAYRRNSAPERDSTIGCRDDDSETRHRLSVRG